MASEDIIPSSFPLPAVSSAIQPFLRPRNETLNIRCQIDAHISSIVKSVTSTSSTSTSTSSASTLSSNRAEKSLTGVRKDYIAALRSHEEALKEWRALTEKVTPRPIPQKLPPTTPTRSTFANTYADDDDSDDELKEDEEDCLASHDRVVYLRGRYEKLLVAKKYLERLQTAFDESSEKAVKGASSMQDIIHSAASNAPIPPPPSAVASDYNVDDILLPLEKAVVSIHQALEKERAMLRGAKELVAHKNTGGATEAAKMRAMRVVKFALEEWLDAQLKQAGEESGTPRKQRDPAAAAHDGKEVDIEEVVSRIQSTYDGYVRSREELLISVQKSSQAEVGGDLRGSTKPNMTINADKPPKEKNEEEDKRLCLLPYIDRLVATSKASKSTHALSAAMAKTVARDSESLSTTIERLRSESRLLDEYHHPTETGGSNTSWIKQWKYAADESRKGVLEGIKGDVKVAETRLDEAEDRLREIKGIMGGDGGVLGKMDGMIGV